MHYPDKNKILPCGEKVPRRNCKKSRRSLNKFKPILIRFVPGFYRGSGGFLPDHGGLYGSTGKPFGWSQDIKNRTKYYKGRARKTPLIESAIHFPPSDKSKFCLYNKNISCDKVDWSVRAGQGKFVVKIYIGDPMVNSKIDLTINGKEIFSGIVKKGVQKLVQKIIEANDEYLTFTSACEKDCNYAMTKMSAVEILPLTDLPQAPSHKSEEIAKCGGSFIKGKFYF